MTSVWTVMTTWAVTLTWAVTAARAVTPAGTATVSWVVISFMLMAVRAVMSEWTTTAAKTHVSVRAASGVRTVIPMGAEVRLVSAVFGWT